MQPPSPAGTCPRTGGLSGHPPSGGGQGGSITPPPLSQHSHPNPPALLHPEAAPGSCRSERRLQTLERPVELEAKAGR